MIFEKPRKKYSKRYSSVNKYIQGVYYANKEKINSKLEGIGSPKATNYKKFQMLVKAYIEQGSTPEQAVRSVSLSNFFETQKGRYNIYFMEGLKKFPDQYQKFRELTKEKGKYTKFDPEKLFWDFEDKVYVYNGNIVIRFKPSPVTVEFWRNGYESYER